MNAGTFDSNRLPLWQGMQAPQAAPYGLCMLAANDENTCREMLSMPDQGMHGATLWELEHTTGTKDARPRIRSGEEAEVVCYADR